MGVACHLFETSLGWVGIAGSEKGLLRATLPRPSAAEARQELGELGDAKLSEDAFRDLPARLRLYFEGRRVAFDDGLDLGAWTDFQRRVWMATRLISFGETRSYGWVARQVGREHGARAVGQALSRNPLPIIVPCHRVIAGDGRLGGYSGGLDYKKFFLWREAMAAP